MAKIACFLAIITLLTAAGATSLRPPQLQEDNGIIQCVEDITSLVSFVPKFIVDAKSGNVSLIIDDVQQLLTLLNSTAYDCGFVHAGANGEAECLADILKAIPMIENLINDLLTGDINAVVADLQQLIPVLEQTVKDCSEGKNSWKLRLFKERAPRINQTCIDDVVELATYLPVVIEHIVEGDIIHLIADLEKLFTIAENVVADCIQGQNTCQLMKPFLNETMVQGQAECIADVLKAIPVIQKLIEDIIKGDITAVITDITQLAPIAEAILKDCTSSMKLTGYNPSLFLNQYPDEKCLEAAQHFQTLLSSLNASIKYKNFQAAQPIAAKAVLSAVDYANACFRRRD